MPEMNGKIGILVSGFVLLLLAVVFIGVVADQTNTITDTQTTRNETHIVATDFAAFDLTHDNVTSVDYVWNGTASVGTTGINNCTINLTYGIINCSQNATYNFTYDFKHDNYLDSSGARAIINVIIILFAIAIIGFGVGIFYKMKEGVF